MPDQPPRVTVKAPSSWTEALVPSANDRLPAWKDWVLLVGLMLVPILGYVLGDSPWWGILMFGIAVGLKVARFALSAWRLRRRGGAS